MPKRPTHEESPVWMTGEYRTDDLLLKRATVREGFSKLTETTVEFKTSNKTIVPKDILGKPMSVCVETPEQGERHFAGLCVSVENLGLQDGFAQFVAEVRPWLWLLTRATNNRIFQDMTAVDIIKKVFADHGLTDFTLNLSESYEQRGYCVQYRETDFAFVSRLMEEEGIYYFFDSGLGQEPMETMVLCDGLSSHGPMPEIDKIEFFARYRNSNRRGDFIGEWSEVEHLTSGRVSLDDFDFTAPTGDQSVMSKINKGSHAYKDLELYHYPGHYRKDTTLGTKQARVRMEAQAVQFKRWQASGNVRTISVGYTFSVIDHPDVPKNDEFLVTEAVHYLQHSADFEDSELRRDLTLGLTQFPDSESEETYRSTFESIPKNEPFRAPLDTPWPEIAGLHTAIVTGPAGEEIATDEHGRIKVQFHWDRDGQKDDKSSCWIRVATPWSGKGWGMIHVPRIGQEVIIQFEEGDPDRPICTGMLYNKDTMPPYPLPDNATQSGVKTNSSKGGGGFNELMMEDKKGAELVRFQAEKDYQQIVKNNATITVGHQKKDPGNQSLNIFNDSAETVGQNKTQQVGKSYHQTIGAGVGVGRLVDGAKLISWVSTGLSLAKGKVAGAIQGKVKKFITDAAGDAYVQKIEGNHTHTVSVNYSQLIGIWHDHVVLGKFEQKIGLYHDHQVGLDYKHDVGENHKHTVGIDYTQEIKQDHKHTVKRDFLQDIDGNHEEMVTKDIKIAATEGDYSVYVNKGTITMEAKQDIILKVGKSSLTLNPSGIILDSPMIKVTAGGMATFEGKVTEVKAKTMMTVKGKPVMIN